jgi:hypothetical protein
MQTGRPYSAYVKTIPGKVAITVFDPFSNKVEGRILVGNPKKDKSAVINLWSAQEDMFFKQKNDRHLREGTLIPYIAMEEIPETESEKLNKASDEELMALLTGRFYTLKYGVEKMTSVAPIYRLLTMAKELEKSEKIIKFLEGRLASLELEQV